MKIGRSLNHFLNKSIKKKRDIFIVSKRDYKNRIKMGGLMQLKIEYDEEYNSSVLKINTGCRFEKAFIGSNWLNNKYIEYETYYQEWYTENWDGGWELLTSENGRKE